MRPSSVLLVSVVLAACGGDPPRWYSQPVGIHLTATSSDTANDVVSDEKAITTESLDPYGAFIANARFALDDHDPSAITVETLSLYLEASSTGVTTLGEIFNGDVEVVFRMSGTGTVVRAGGGHVDPGTTAGPYDLDASFVSDVDERDWPQMLSGGFDVVLRGPADPEFATRGADADLQLMLEFAAFE